MRGNQRNHLIFQHPASLDIANADSWIQLGSILDKENDNLIIKIFIDLVK